MKQSLSSSERYKLAYKMVIADYWHEIKSRWKLSIPAILLTASNNILIVYVPPLIIAKIIEQAASGTRVINDFLPYIGMFALAYLSAEAIMRIAIHLMIRIEVQAISKLYDDALTKLLTRDLTFFHNNFAGSLTKKTLGYAGRFVDVFDTITFNVTSKLFPILFASIVLAFYSPWLTLCLLAWLAIGVLAAYPLIKRRVKLVNERETAFNVVSGHVADIYGNIDAVRSHASENKETILNRTHVKDLGIKLTKSWDYQNKVIDIIIAPIYVATNVSGLILALYLVQQGTIHYTALIVIFTYFMAVTNFLWEFNSIYKRLESAVADGAQFTELLLTKPSIIDPENPVEIKHPKGQIEFKEVDFKYTDSNKLLFDNLSLSINSQEKIGLIGRSGGGKTSITKLLLRFVDITNGSIRIDGIDIRNMTQEHLRSLISYVPQEPVMFHRTIADNIAYGKSDATQQEIEAAAKKANAHAFILGLPDGYQTLVGERGVKLSGGQRQRIAIARAVLKDAPILLLDEATSALDSESEKLIQDALHTLMQDKTTLVIAHRLSTIQEMDRIIVLDHGAIIEQGDHKKLIKQKGVYASLWAHQSGGFIEE